MTYEHLDYVYPYIPSGGMAPSWRPGVEAAKSARVQAAYEDTLARYVIETAVIIDSIKRLA